MPALQVLPERQPKPLTGWSHVMSKIGQGLGQGLESGMVQGANLSLNQKMEALQDQRKLDYAKKAYAQQQEQMAPFLEQAEKETPGARLAYQLLGPDKYAEILKTVGRQGITTNFGPGSRQAGGFNNLQQMGPQRQMEAPNNQMVPIQDREAVDEQEMQQMQQMPAASSQTQQQPQQGRPQNTRRTMDDFITDEMQRAGISSMEGVSPDYATKIKKAAEISFNAQEKTLKGTREAEKHEREMEMAPSTYVQDVEKRFSGWHKQKPNYTFMANNASKITSTAGLKKAVSDRFNVPYGIMLNDTEQALDKFASAIVQGVSQAYPGQIKVAEIENFIKSNPSLFNSPQSIQNLAKASLKIGELTEEEYKESQKLRQEYRKRGERLPENFHALVLEKIQPKFDAINDEFEKVMSEKIVSPFKKWEPGKGNNFSGERVKVTDPEGKSYWAPKELKEAFLKKGYK